MSKLDNAVALAVEANGWDEETAREVLAQNGYDVESDES